MKKQIRQSHFLIERKIQSQGKPSISQSRAGIRSKTPHNFPMLQPHHKVEQLRLLSGRNPIIQIAERPILQPSKIIHQGVKQVINNHLNLNST